jgi:hypothetical protein
MRSRSLLAAALLVSAAACGARSTLNDPAVHSAGSGGTGTSAVTSTGASTSATAATTGPGGGPGIFCSALIAVEPQVELPAAAPNGSARDPWLDRLPTGDVVAVARHVPVGGPMFAPQAIETVRLNPWTGWPPIIHPANKTLDITPDAPFVAAAEPQDTFAVGVMPYPMSAPAGCTLAAIYGMSPYGAPGPGSLTAHLNDDCNALPISVATAEDGTHFVASDTFLSMKDGKELRGMVVTLLDPGGDLIASPNLACASNRFVGDVLAKGPDFLFVQSSSDSVDCSTEGTARRLFLRRFQGATEESFIVADGFDDMVYARILPRPGGSWIFYRESGASAEVQPPGMAVPFGVDSAAGTAFPVTDVGSGPMAVAALAGGFVVAFADLVDPSAPTIVVRVYSTTGTLTSQSSFSTNEVWWNGDRLTLIASPDGTRFLVGWTGKSGVVGSDTGMFVRRFDCAGAL